MTFYLVATAWRAAKRRTMGIGVPDIALLMLALADGIGATALGVAAASSAAGSTHGAPAAACFVAASIVPLFALGDLRMFSRGGVAGARRIARHAGRMGTALFIATASLFLGQQQVFPVFMHKSPLMHLPVIVVVAATIFWLIRARRTSAARSMHQWNEFAAAAYPAHPRVQDRTASAA